jgi:hypothetical protein
MTSEELKRLVDEYAERAMSLGVCDADCRPGSDEFDGAQAELKRSKDEVHKAIDALGLS